MYSKHRLWLTINSLENIPSIDNRQLYADTLHSIDNNIFKISQVRLPELNNVYNQNYNELKQLLFQKYLNIIKDTEAGLADLIIQDLQDNYQNQVSDSFNVIMIGGNGADDASKMGPPPSKARELASALVGTSVPAPPPVLPPPPPPPPMMQFTKLDYNRLSKLSEAKLTLTQLLDLRNYELTTTPIVYTKDVIIKLNTGKKDTKEKHEDVLKSALGKRRHAIAGRSKSRRKFESEALPELEEKTGTVMLGTAASERTINYEDLANRVKKNVLALIPPYTKEVCQEMGNLIEDFHIYLMLKHINRNHDNTYLTRRVEILNNKLKDKKIPVWRYNYEIMSYLLKIASPPINVSDLPRPVYEEYYELIRLIADFNRLFLNDNDLNNASLKLF